MAPGHHPARPLAPARRLVTPVGCRPVTPVGCRLVIRRAVAPETVYMSIFFAKGFIDTSSRL